MCGKYRRVRSAHRHKQDELEFIKIYANSHYVTPRPTLVQAIKVDQIRIEDAAGSAP